eukprot:scaffold42881_cov31-Tisochrysis_lutea.AAC.2
MKIGLPGLATAIICVITVSGSCVWSSALTLITRSKLFRGSRYASCSPRICCTRTGGWSPCLSSSRWYSSASASVATTSSERPGCELMRNPQLSSGPAPTSSSRKCVWFTRLPRRSISSMSGCSGAFGSSLRA